MKCNKCDSDMKKFFEENLYVPCKSYFITEDGERVSLYVCPKCGKVQGEVFKENGRVVKYCQLKQLALLGDIMKKVYVVTDGEKVLIACKSEEDAEDLVKMWGKHYTYSVVEIPYIDIQKESVLPSYSTYKNKSSEVEPMPFVSKNLPL